MDFAGFLTVCVLVAAFGWAYTTQMSGAIITSGVVQRPQKQWLYKTHKVAKFLKFVLLKANSLKNQKLLSFNADELNTGCNCAIESELLAKRARLEAEIDNSDSMDFTRLKHIAEASIVDQQMNAQETIFKSRREIVKKQVEQLDQRVVQIASLIGGLQDQKHLLTEEIELVQSLLYKTKRSYLKRNSYKIARLLS